VSLVEAVGNFVGAHFGAEVAKTVGDGLVKLPLGIPSLGVVFAGVVGAIAWNLITWYYGLPSSSSHALFGGLVGATLFATEGTVQWGTIVSKVLIPMVASPLVGFVLGFLVMVAIMWAFRRGQPGKLNRGFLHAQTVSAAFMSVGHGMQDAAKTMGIIVLALYTGGFQDSATEIPWWVFWTSATVSQVVTKWYSMPGVGAAVQSTELSPPVPPLRWVRRRFPLEACGMSVMYSWLLAPFERSSPPVLRPKEKISAQVRLVETVPHHSKVALPLRLEIMPFGKST
jgi:phosphate/sulfate permease